MASFFAALPTGGKAESSVNRVSFVAFVFGAVGVGSLLPAGGKAGSLSAIFAFFDIVAAVVGCDQGLALLCNLLVPRVSLFMIAEGAHGAFFLLDAFFAAGNAGAVAGVITADTPLSAFLGVAEFGAGQA